MPDNYANIAEAQVTANGTTIAFTELQTGISLAQKRGIVIDKIEYTFARDDIGALADNEDINIGWVTSNSITSLNTNQKQVIHAVTLGRVDMGTAATAQIYEMPVQFMYTPPLIVAAQRIYLAVDSADSGSQNIHSSRLYFRYIDLKTEEYLEIAESFVLVG